MMYFVGVGPGDPELITMKALRILQEVDALAIPDSGKDSAVWKIAGKWMESKPICYLPMPMKGRKEEWEDAHRQAVAVLLEWLKKYETMAYPVLGDPGIYASSSYILKYLDLHHPCKVIPGVPAMCAAAAELKVALCEQNERLIVLDHITSNNILDGNVVIMKARASIQSLENLYKERKVYIASNVGLDNQKIGEIAEGYKDLTYFTTALIK